MRRVLSVMLVALAAATAARASPYWIEYEPAGGLFPEEEGWTRLTNFGGAERSLEDGWLVLDGRADPRIQDAYRMQRPGTLDPDLGEQFVAAWRLQVDSVSAYYDPYVGIFSDQNWGVAFTLSDSAIYSVFETDVSAPFTPGVPHAFELRSSDMLSYTLLIDGTPALYGDFWESLTTSQITWGDGAIGTASLARWDYFSFGVVPECSSLMLVAGLWGSGLSIRSRPGR